jgi:hypothetical protein
MILLVDLGECNEVEAEMAVKELRRVVAGYEGAAALRVQQGQMTADVAFGKIQPAKIALNVCQAVWAAFGEQEELEKVMGDRLEVKGKAAGNPLPHTPDLSPAAVLCCLCDQPGVEMYGGLTWLCKNPACIRSKTPLPRNTFEGLSKFEEGGMGKTPQDRAGRAVETDVTQTGA